MTKKASRRLIEYTLAIVLISLLALAATSVKGQELKPAPKREAVLQELNRQRARRGLYPFIYSEKLTTYAAKEAREQARRGRMGHHLGIGKSGAQMGGVGYSSGRDPQGKRFITCGCWDRKHKYAGAALYVTRGKTYYAFYSR